MYTIQIRKILCLMVANKLEIPLDQVYLLPPHKIIEEGRSEFFDFGYPMWDEEYRPVFETNFLFHFYQREIGQDTWVSFKQELMAELFVQMPYYNQFYDSTTWYTKYNVNPVENTDYKETWSRNLKNDYDDTSRNISEGTNESTNTGNNTATTSVNSSSLDSDTPQVQLSGREDYATALNKTNGATTTGGESKDTSLGTVNSKADVTNQGKNSTDETYEFHRHGNIGVQTFGDIVESNRKGFLNVDEMVFIALEPVFLQLF